MKAIRCCWLIGCVLVSSTSCQQVEIVAMDLSEIPDAGSDDGATDLDPDVDTDTDPDVDTDTDWNGDEGRACFAGVLGGPPVLTGVCQSPALSFCWGGFAGVEDTPTMPIIHNCPGSLDCCINDHECLRIGMMAEGIRTECVGSLSEDPGDGFLFSFPFGCSFPVSNCYVFME